MPKNAKKSAPLSSKAISNSLGNMIYGMFLCSYDVIHDDEVAAGVERVKPHGFQYFDDFIAAKTAKKQPKKKSDTNSKPVDGDNPGDDENNEEDEEDAKDNEEVKDNKDEKKNGGCAVKKPRVKKLMTVSILLKHKLYLLLNKCCQEVEEVLTELNDDDKDITYDNINEIMLDKNRVSIMKWISGSRFANIIDYNGEDDEYLLFIKRVLYERISALSFNCNVNEIAERVTKRILVLFKVIAYNAAYCYYSNSIPRNKFTADSIINMISMVNLCNKNKIITEEFMRELVKSTPSK